MTRRGVLQVGVACIFVCAAVLGARVYQVKAAQRFSSGRWKAERGQTLRSPARYYMVEDLKTRLPIGMVRADVLELLGSPDYGGMERIGYKVGMPDLAIDYYEFEIEFDEAGRLSKVALIQG